MPVSLRRSAGAYICVSECAACGGRGCPVETGFDACPGCAAPPAPRPGLLPLLRPLESVWQEPDDEFAVPGLAMRGGLTALYAPPKTGKTVLLLALCRAADTLRPFCGYTVGPLTVWIFSEESPKTLKMACRRLDDYLRDGPGLNPHKLLPRAAAPPSLRGTEQVAQYVYDAYATAGPQAQPDLIIVDTLAGFAGLGEDANDFAMATELLLPIRQLTAAVGAEGGAGVIITHQARKAGGDAVSAMLGSTALAASCDILASVARVKGQPAQRRITVQGRFATDPWQDGVATVELRGGDYVLIETGADANLDSLTVAAVNDGARARKAIVNWVNARQQADEQEPATERAVDAALARALAEGEIVRVGRGLYAPAPPPEPAPPGAPASL